MKKTKLSRMQKPKKSGHIPATARQLELVRRELKGDITTLRLETKAGFAKVDAKFVELTLSFKSEVSKITAALYEVRASVEEQNSRNRFALDGYTSVYDKQISTEERVGKLEKKVFGSRR